MSRSSKGQAVLFLVLVAIFLFAHHFARGDEPPNDFDRTVYLKNVRVEQLPDVVVRYQEFANIANYEPAITWLTGDLFYLIVDYEKHLGGKISQKTKDAFAQLHVKLVWKREDLRQAEGMGEPQDSVSPEEDLLHLQQAILKTAKNNWKK